MSTRPRDRVGALERRMDELQRSFATLSRSQGEVHADVEELFAELAQALDVIAASLDELVPADEREGWSERTGVLGRACELRGLVRIFRGNLVDLQQRVRATKSPRETTSRPAG